MLFKFIMENDNCMLIDSEYITIFDPINRNDASTQTIKSKKGKWCLKEIIDHQNIELKSSISNLIFFHESHNDNNFYTIKKSDKKIDINSGTCCIIDSCFYEQTNKLLNDNNDDELRKYLICKRERFFMLNSFDEGSYNIEITYDNAELAICVNIIYDDDSSSGYTPNYLSSSDHSDINSHDDIMDWSDEE